jgi:hypothetical protein
MRTNFAALIGVWVVAAMTAAPLTALGMPTRMACHKPATGCSHHVALSAGCCKMGDQTAVPASVPVTPDPPLSRAEDASPVSLAFVPEPPALLHIPASPPRVALLDLPTLFSTFLI